MKDAPALTIITVCRNEPNIERTCESIVSQTWQDFEWIVVDGASTDGTLDILEKYKDRIDVFVSEPDTGIFNAMNKGIRLAHGEFLNFMNGGDEFVSPRTLETVFSGTTKQYRGYGVVFGDAIIEKDGRRNLVSFPRERAITRLVVEGFSINHQAAFIRRDLFQKFGPYDESFRIIADFKKFLVLIKNKISFLNLEFPVSIFNLDGVSQQNRTATVTEKQAAATAVFSRKELKRFQRKNLRTASRGLLFSKIELFRLTEDSAHKKRIFSLLGVPLFGFQIKRALVPANRQPTTYELARALNGCVAKEGRIFSDLASRIGRARALSLPAASLHQEVFPKYRGINAGKELVIVGAGPTLDDYEPIPGAVHVGVNKTFLCEKLSLDYLFIQDYFEDIQDAADAYRPGLCKKFYGYHPDPLVRGVPAASAERANAERYFFEDIPVNDPSPFPFPPDIARAALGTFSSIIFPALQFALWTRPKRIYLVGCDCSSLGYCSGILDKTAAQTKFPLDVERLLYGWTKMKEFIEKFYPDVEIVSVNPVGLKGWFKDMEQKASHE